MKKRLLSLALALVMCLSLLPASALAAGSDVAIDKTTFPDDIFREYVETLPGAEDGVFTAQELADIKKIELFSYYDIQDLTGIEYFTELTELYSAGKELTKLDLSHNTKLTYLSCSDNRLTELDLSHNTELVDLFCSENQLTQLDLSHNTKLDTLSFGLNRMACVDLSSCADSLTNVYGVGNSFIAAEGDSMSELPGFDLSKVREIEGGNFDDGKVHFDEGANWLDYFYDCGWDEPILFKIYRADGPMVAIDETNFPDPTFRKEVIEAFEDLNGDGFLTIDEFSLITSLEFSNQFFFREPIRDLTGIEHLTELEVLHCNDSALTELDLSRNTKLTELDCSGNMLTQLDLSHNPELTKLDCSDNPMAALDLSSNAKLAELTFDSREITVKNGAPLSQLPGLDPDRASNFQGGIFEGGKVNFTDSVITYDYDTKCPADSVSPSPIITVTLRRGFIDLPENSWFTEPVKWAVKEGITTGMTMDEFGPTATCNRAQIVTFLWNMKDSPESNLTESPFSDVPMNTWFTKPVLWAVNHSITTGMTDTEFGPTAICNRAQAMVFLWKSLGCPYVSYEMHFTDVPEDAWYCEAVRWAVKEGITKGMTDTEFGPTTPCNRAQIVTFLYAAHQAHWV